MSNIIKYLERATLKQEVYDAINYKKDKKLKTILNKNVFDDSEYNHFLCTTFHNLKDDNTMLIMAEVFLKQINHIDSICLEASLWTPKGLSALQNKKINFSNLNHQNIAIGLAKNEIMEKNLFIDLIDATTATQIFTAILIRNIKDSDFVLENDMIEKFLPKISIEYCIEQISQMEKNIMIDSNSILKKILKNHFHFNLSENVESKNLKILFDNFIIFGSLEISENKIKNSIIKL